MLLEYVATLELYEVAYNALVQPVLSALDAKLGGSEMRMALAATGIRPRRDTMVKCGGRRRISERKCSALQAYWDILHVADTLTEPLSGVPDKKNPVPDDAVLSIHRLFVEGSDCLQAAQDTLDRALKVIRDIL